MIICVVCAWLARVRAGWGRLEDRIRRQVVGLQCSLLLLMHTWRAANDIVGGSVRLSDM